MIANIAYNGWMSLKVALSIIHWNNGKEVNSLQPEYHILYPCDAQDRCFTAIPLNPENYKYRVPRSLLTVLCFLLQ